MKEAILYRELGNSGVQCSVCGHRCVIKDGDRGICGVRENLGGKLYSLNYGKSVAAAVDPIEKKPLYHYLPGSLTYSLAAAGCNFRCVWCQNWEISQSPKPRNAVEGCEISPEEHARRACAFGCPSVSYTYSEPTVFVEYALDTMKLARENGLKNIWVSNGFMTKETLDVILPFLDAANIDFKGPDDDVYMKYCGGFAAPVMENLKQLSGAGVHLEITTLVVPDVNDKSEQLKRIADFIAQELRPDIPWHISRFFPSWKMPDTPPTPMETLQKARDIGRLAGLRHIHIGNV